MVGYSCLLYGVVNWHTSFSRSRSNALITGDMSCPVLLVMRSICILHRLPLSGPHTPPNHSAPAPRRLGRYIYIYRAKKKSRAHRACCWFRLYGSLKRRDEFFSRDWSIPGVALPKNTWIKTAQRYEAKYLDLNRSSWTLKSLAFNLTPPNH